MSSFDLLVATHNAGKLREYQELLRGLDVNLFSLADKDITLDVEEPFETLEENAAAKAQGYAQHSGLFTLADDTGLFVDALPNGGPGAWPARYGGPGLTVPQRRQKLLEALAGVPEAERTARFICVIALGNPQDNSVQQVQGVVEGRIALEEDEQGKEGFGYDALFIPEGYDVAWSSVPLAEKNQLSHRGRATQAIIPLIEAQLKAR
jgi:XTP/dITP diphosphohydrolase